MIWRYYNPGCGNFKLAVGPAGGWPARARKGVSGSPPRVGKAKWPVVARLGEKFAPPI